MIGILFNCWVVVMLRLEDLSWTREVIFYKETFNMEIELMDGVKKNKMFKDYFLTFEV
jgi:hypothetical protein